MSKMKWVELHDDKGAQNLKCIHCGGYFTSLYYLSDESTERITQDKEHETAMCDACSSFHADDQVDILILVDGHLSAQLDYVITQVFIANQKPEIEFPKGEFGNEETRRANTFNPNEPPDTWYGWTRARTEDW